MASANALYQKYSDNVASSATLTAPTGTIDATYPLTNVHDGDPAKPCKFTSTSGSIQFTYVAKQPLQNVGLIHCTADAGLTVQIMGDDGADWVTPDFSANIVIPAWLATGTTRAWPVNPWLDLTAQVGYDALGFTKWLLKFGTNSQAIQIGQVWLGATNRRFSPNIQWDTTPVDTKPIVEHRTSSGVSTIYSHGTTLYTLEGNIRHTVTQKAAIREQWYDADGRTYAFLLVPDGLANRCHLVRWATNEQRMQEHFTNNNTMRLAFEELSRGRRPGV